MNPLNPVACRWASLFIMSHYNEHRCLELACSVMQPIVSLPIPPVCSVLECTIFCLSLAMTTYETRSMHEMNSESAVTVIVMVQQAECW